MTLCSMTENNFISFSGKAYIPEGLVQGNAYTVELQGEITRVQRDLYDGSTINITHRISPITATVKDDHGQVMKIKDTRSNSQKFRRLLKMYFDQDDTADDFDRVYNRVYQKLLANAESIYNNAKMNL